MAFNRDPKIITKYGLLFNSVPVTYSGYGVDVEIPRYEVSDGPTLQFITKFFFTTREFLLGADAALVHDYMCRHKSEYSRKVASMMLRDIWILCGLSKIKGYFVYYLVDFYQWFRYRHDWKE